MDSAVISDQLLEVISDRKVKAALFTTYTFEPEFFELEIIPLLLKRDIPYSADERVKQFQVRENLREADLSIDVFYDLPMFRECVETSPEMEYLCHGVNNGNAAFHGKLVFLLLEDSDYQEDILYVGAGSNNLSRSGWWNNVEVMHWEEVRLKGNPRRFLNKLSEDLQYLRHKRAFTDADSSLEKIDTFLTSCRASNDADPIYYYGISHVSERTPFMRFINNKNQPLSKTKNWQLEIISPFFADDVNNKMHESFLKMGVKHIQLFLPTDDEGKALCHPDYYRHINKAEGISWASWESNISQRLGMNDDYFRNVHAKIYHFYNKQTSWAFVGSVNFTHKATHENAEAGYLVKLGKPTPLLEQIIDTDSVEEFSIPNETVPGTNANNIDDKALPEIYLRFNWLTKELTGRCVEDKTYTISLLGPEKDSIISKWKITNEEKTYTQDTTSIEKVLLNGSLIKIIDSSKDNSFYEHTILLQQINWSHKPIDFPDLTPEQILAIYASMDPERRNLILINAQIKHLVLANQCGELTTHDDEMLIDQFFCEYAEIFHAFRLLRKRLSKALNNKEDHLVDYYLTGAGMDSLPSLIERCIDNDKQEVLNGITAYLLLLSSVEIYKDKKYHSRQNVKVCLKKVKKTIADIKKSERINLGGDTVRRERFYTWFESQFFENSTSLSVSKNQAVNK